MEEEKKIIDNESTEDIRQINENIKKIKTILELCDEIDNMEE